MVSRKGGGLSPLSLSLSPSLSLSSLSAVYYTLGVEEERADNVVVAAAFANNNSSKRDLDCAVWDGERERERRGESEGYK